MDALACARPFLLGRMGPGIQHLHAVRDGAGHAPFCAFIKHARLARGPRMLQRPFLPPLPLRLPKPCARPKGEISAGGFGLSAFGFLFSRLLLCCLFATSNLPFEVTDAGAYSVDSPVSLAERRTKSSSTLAISNFLRGSCAVVVDAKRPSR